MTVKDKNGEHPWGDLGQVVLLCLFLAFWAADSFYFRLTTSLSGYVPLSVRLFVLAVAFASAAGLLMSGHVAVKVEQRPASVISSGAFRLVRHPMYLGALLASLGLSVSTASLASLVPLLALFIFYRHITSFEEEIMVTKFGDEYRQYQARTGKWFPRLGRRNRHDV